METARLIYDARAQLGEGALWDAARRLLLWVDITAGEIHFFDPLTGADRALRLGRLVGTVVPREAGGLFAALPDGVYAVDPDTGETALFAPIEARKPENRLNDGKCDPDGRFWVGSMSLRGAPHDAALYRVERDGAVCRVLPDVGLANGLAWSPDETTMYFIDTPTQTVWAYAYDRGTGALSGRRAAVVVPAEWGSPDGMTVDAEGMLWVAHWGGARVVRYDPRTGKALYTVHVPAQNVTSCAFGAQSLDVLYITTSRAGLDGAALARWPNAGGLFEAHPGCRGLPAYPCRA